MDERLKELTRIYADPLYLLKYVKIQEPGELALDYQLWPHLIEFFNDLETYKYLIMVKPKQVGISWGLGYWALRTIATIEGSNVLEISSGQDEAKKLLEKSQIILNNFPDWLKNLPDYEPFPNSTEHFGLKGMHSLITALPSTIKAGIGHTSDLVIHDEADFHDYFEINLSHTMATVADSPKRKLVVVSTVDVTKPDSHFKQLYKGAEGSGYPEAGSNNFRALFFPYNVRPDRDEEWYEEQKKTHSITPWVVKANFPKTIEEALSPLTTQSCFKAEVLKELWENAIEPETRQNYIHILCPPSVGTQYAGGIDVGEGVGLDYSSFTIIGQRGLQAEVVANIYTNTVGTDAFAYDCFRLYEEYFKPTLCVDNIGIGRAVIDKLEQLGCTDLYRGGIKSQKAGWPLTRNNKRELVTKLVEVINDGSLITRFKPQIKELMEYQWVNGYPEPTGKTHGDTVISLMFANQMRNEIRGKRTCVRYL